MPYHLLQVEGLTIASGQGPVVSNLSFFIDPGEFVALTGKSGSGKTSIAMALLNLLPENLSFQAGSIVWDDQHRRLQLPDDSAVWGDLRGKHIGFTQQDIFGAFDPVLRMGHQMLMVVKERVPAIPGEIEHELRVKMEEVGLHDINRLWLSYPHQLSGGQLQRCQLAMAMVMKPALLITDEPTSAIDRINQLELLDVFRMLNSKYNMAILCITHEEGVVRYLAAREIQLSGMTNDYIRPEPGSIGDSLTQTESVIEAKDLEFTHAFGGMLYKKGGKVGKISFTLSEGTCLGIVGASGSGKSTLAQMLVGLYAPSQGHLIIDGLRIDFQQLADVRRLRSAVQLVMQDGRGSLHPHFTIRKTLREIIAIRQQTDPSFNPDLENLLREMELPARILDCLPGQLSGGECLRVSIARALVLNPRVLICDESTSALDGETRDGIIQLLLALKRGKGLAIIFISHDERVIRGLADQVMVLENGEVVETGPAEEVIRFPTHPVTRKIFTIHATLEQRGRL